jgi:hypothetical protein
MKILGKILCAIGLHDWQWRTEFIIYGVSDYHGACARPGCDRRMTARAEAGNMDTADAMMHHALGPFKEMINGKQ